MMKIDGYLLVVVFLCLATHGCTHLQKNEDIVFQASTISALLEGVYDGNVTYKDLKKRGDFGIGTFNSLDGEMIGLEGKFYQIKDDGMAYSVPDTMKTPFAVVTFFKPNEALFLDNTLPTKNIIYSFKIEVDFKYRKPRSVPKQSKPYPPLIESVKDQPTFEVYNVKGTIAGFWFPDYMEGINVPGYHFHLITKDKKAGGHLLECELQNVRIEIDYISELFMALPENSEFYNADLTQKKTGELEKVEK